MILSLPGVAWGWKAGAEHPKKSTRFHYIFSQSIWGQCDNPQRLNLEQRKHKFCKSSELKLKVDELHSRGKQGERWCFRERSLWAGQYQYRKQYSLSDILIVSTIFNISRVSPNLRVISMSEALLLSNIFCVVVRRNEHWATTSDDYSWHLPSA